ncbi:MAG: nitrogen regulation protein NR(II) [Betaproteobacteria bacterium]|jgi:two-component system nitrogen regulation sensor histidine kinase GlnL
MRIFQSRAATAALFSPQDVLDQMPNSVLLLDRELLAIVYANTAAEIALKIARKNLVGFQINDIFGEYAQLDDLFHQFSLDGITQRTDLILGAGNLRPDQKEHLAYVILASLEGTDLIVFEWFEIDQQMKSAREERLIMQARANKELMRNLAHEIKNPLGGIRGAAQLLDYELPDPSLKEYTKVMIKEVDRLQTLVDRLLAPHKRKKEITEVNIHEVLERVRSVVLAEFAQGLSITRFYDVSLPDIIGDKEILIQALLNIVHNAAQILEDRRQIGDAKIQLQTSVSRNVTIGKKRYKLALNVHVIDNGPGIPAEIIDHIFLPLVSGRASGSGLGLTLAQSFIQMHGGFISVHSQPGDTNFHVQIPYMSMENINNSELRGEV